MPLVSEGCADLAAKITAENRRLVHVPAREVSMQLDGRIVLGESGVFDLTEYGFDGLVEQLGYGGAKYLRDHCTPELRAGNVNAQRLIIAGREDAAAAEPRPAGKDAPGPRIIAARVRDRAPSTDEQGVLVDAGGPEVFAAVSANYPTFDGDKIAEAFARAMPPDARGTVRYDAATTGTRFDALFQTTVQPEHFVCGEVFRTGIRVRANDSGDGSIVVRAIAFQNLCLNLIIVDRACREIARIRHIGTVHELQLEFAKALAKAMRAIEPFLRQWGYACGEDLVARLTADGAKLPSNPDDIMRGIFRGLLTSRRVKFPRLPGKGRDAILDALVDAWRSDSSGATAQHRGVTRAAVVNAITKTAQEWMDAKDPWATDGLELDAARLLWGAGNERPAPLVYVDVDDAGEIDIVELPAGAATA